MSSFPKRVDCRDGARPIKELKEGGSQSGGWKAAR